MSCWYVHLVGIYNKLSYGVITSTGQIYSKHISWVVSVLARSLSLSLFLCHEYVYLSCPVLCCPALSTRNRITYLGISFSVINMLNSTPFAQLTCT